MLETEARHGSGRAADRSDHWGTESAGSRSVPLDRDRSSLLSHTVTSEELLQVRECLIRASCGVLRGRCTTMYSGLSLGAEAAAHVVCGGHEVVVSAYLVHRFTVSTSGLAISGARGAQLTRSALWDG